MRRRRARIRKIVDHSIIKHSSAAMNRAIEYFGSPQAMADALCVERQCIYQWRSTYQTDRLIPIEIAYDVEDLTKKHVTIQDLRPDVFRS